MPWIESHTVLRRHRKVKELARALRIKPVYVMGHLHALWHDALEQQEDGDLSSWSDDLIAESADYDGDVPRFVSLLQAHGWLDDRRIHDWLDYAGRYLEAKYRTSNPQRLAQIIAKHKLKRQSDYSPPKNGPPDLPTSFTPFPASGASASPEVNGEEVCLYCGATEKQTFWRFETDHFRPRHANGTDDPDNLKRVCHFCNQAKSKRVFETVEECRAWLHKRYWSSNKKRYRDHRKVAFGGKPPASVAKPHVAVEELPAEEEIVTGTDFAKLRVILKKVKPVKPVKVLNGAPG